MRLKTTKATDSEVSLVIDNRCRISARPVIAEIPLIFEGVDNARAVIVLSAEEARLLHAVLDVAIRDYYGKKPSTQEKP